MIFLVSFMFGIQALLFGYSRTDLTAPPQNTDAYLADNIRLLFEDAMNSSPSGLCNETSDNIEIIKRMLENKISAGRELSLTGDLECEADGSWPSQPELTMEITIISDIGETELTFDANH
ncbi:MAG: hypothetical protein ABIH52_01265 [Candidatus Aenigmatarchaeota archaeon]